MQDMLFAVAVGALVLIFFFGKDKAISWFSGMGEAVHSFNKAKNGETTPTKTSKGQN